MNEPIWLEFDEVLLLQRRELARYGGLEGVRDAGALESALNRPRHRWAYEKEDLYALAAAYAFGLARNHAFLRREQADRGALHGGVPWSEWHTSRDGQRRA